MEGSAHIQLWKHLMGFEICKMVGCDSANTNFQEKQPCSRQNSRTSYLKVHSLTSARVSRRK